MERGHLVKDLPNPFWALLFMVLGCVLLIVVLLKITANTTQIEIGILMAVATAGTNMITGAFGYIQGVSAAKNSMQIPVNPDSPTPQVTLTPQTESPVAPLPGTPLPKS
jgi:hypothetical protein